MVTSIIALAEVANAQMQVEYPKQVSALRPYRAQLSEIIILKHLQEEAQGTGVSIHFASITKPVWKAISTIPGWLSSMPRYHITSSIFAPEYADNVTAKDIGYDIYTTFLPYRPVAVDLYARKIDYTFNLTGEPLDTTSNLYGARLRMHKRNWPSIRLEYYHWDYQILRSNRENKKDTVQEDRYTLDVRGRVGFLATRYQVFVDYLSLSRLSLDDNILVCPYKHRQYYQTYY